MTHSLALFTFWRRSNNCQVHGDNDEKQGDNHARPFSAVVRNNEADPGDEDEHGRREVELEQERRRGARQPDVDACDGEVLGRQPDNDSVRVRDDGHIDLFFKGKLTQEYRISLQNLRFFPSARSR